MSILTVNINILVINTSLDRNSKCRVMATSLFEKISNLSKNVEFVDLFDYALPFCDGDTSYGHEQVNALNQKIKHALGIILVTPIYSYGINAAGKNLLELTGNFWHHKVVGFACVGREKEMPAGMIPLGNTLLVNHQCVLIPKFVNATKEMIRQEKIDNPELDFDLSNLASIAVNFTTALAPHLSIMALKS